LPDLIYGEEMTFISSLVWFMNPVLGVYFGVYAARGPSGFPLVQNTV